MLSDSATVEKERGRTRKALNGADI